VSGSASRYLYCRRNLKQLFETHVRDSVSHATLLNLFAIQATQCLTHCEWGPSVTPRFCEMEPKPLYVCPEFSHHSYSNNMVNRYNISFKLQTKILQIEHWVRNKFTIMQWWNLSADGASTGTTEEEVGFASFFFILLIPLISTATFDSI
jgi:hypothetical protein